VTNRKRWKGMLWFLVLFVVVGVIAGAGFFPVFRIYGSSMSPTLNKGEIVVAVRGTEWKRGDIIAFSYNNKILIKRLIAGPGSVVNIDAEGIVSVNNKPLEEPYLTGGEGGSGNELDCLVPEGEYFVLGDCRTIAMDSRDAGIGCVPRDRIIGRIVFRFWDLSRFGVVH